MIKRKDVNDAFASEVFAVCVAGLKWRLPGEHKMEGEGRSYAEADQNAIAIMSLETCDVRNQIQHTKHSEPNDNPYESNEFLIDSLSRNLLAKNLF